MIIINLLSLPVIALFAWATLPLPPLNRWAAVASVLLLFGLGHISGALAFDPTACEMIAREESRHDFMRHDDADLALITPGSIEYRFSRNFFRCLNSDEAPEIIVDADPLATEAAWIAMVKREIDAKLALGTVPATEAPAPEVDDATVKCRRYYRTFDEADGTVVRRHHKGRVKCPFL